MYESAAVETAPNKPPSVTYEALLSKIDENGGKIPYGTFMDISLFGPDGYYSTGKSSMGFSENRRNPEHDFLTSPESSHMFGITIGESLHSVWESMGKPSNFRIVEMGAGVGTMAKSLLDGMQRLHPDFYDSIRYTILDFGGMIEKQQKTVGENHAIDWIEGTVEEFPLRNIEGAFIYNELPDALSIEQVTRINGEIKQKYVIHPDNEFVETWDEASEEVQDYIQRHDIVVEEDKSIAINSNAEKLYKELAAALERGVILGFDYGGMHLLPTAEAVRCYKNGKQPQAKQYQTPGEVDITSDVDFGPLEKIASEKGLQTVFSGFQTEFLLRENIFDLRSKLIDLQNKSASWNEVLAIARDTSIMDMAQLLQRYNNFYTHLLAKGLDNFQIPNASNPTADVEKYNKQQIEFPLVLGNPHETVYAAHNHLGVVASQLLLPMDEIAYNDGQLEQFTISENGKIVYRPVPLIYRKTRQHHNFFVSGQGGFGYWFVTDAMENLGALESTRGASRTLSFYDGEGSLIAALGNLTLHTLTEEKREQIRNNLEQMPEKEIKVTRQIQAKGLTIPLTVQRIARKKIEDNVIESVIEVDFNEDIYRKKQERVVVSKRRGKFIRPESSLLQLSTEKLLQLRRKAITDSGYTLEEQT